MSCFWACENRHGGTAEEIWCPACFKNLSFALVFIADKRANKGQVRGWSFSTWVLKAFPPLYTTKRKNKLTKTHHLTPFQILWRARQCPHLEGDLLISEATLWWWGTARNGTEWTWVQAEWLDTLPLPPIYSFKRGEVYFSPTLESRSRQFWAVRTGLPSSTGASSPSGCKAAVLAFLRGKKGPRRRGLEAEHITSTHVQNL